MHGARTGLPLADVRLLPPLKPASVRDFVAFEEHVQGVRQAIEGTGTVPDAWYDAPTFYFTNPHASSAQTTRSASPAQPSATSSSRSRSWSASPAASLSVDEAAEHVFGYTIMNDWSARDVQGREMQVGLGPAKGKDFGTTLGPWIVTADELEPYSDADGFLDLWCTVSVNGDEIGRDLLSGMGWTFETLIAYASRDSAVEAGDVLGSGTVGNGGCLAELWGRRGTQDPPPLQLGRRGHPDRRRSRLPHQHSGSRCRLRPHFRRYVDATPTRPGPTADDRPDRTHRGRDRSRLGDRGAR